MPIGRLQTDTPYLCRNLCVQADAVVHWQLLSRHLPVGGSEKLKIDTVQQTVGKVECHATPHSGIDPCLDTALLCLCVRLATMVLGYNLEGDIYMEGRGGAVGQEARRQPVGEALLMVIATVDEALPVYPCVKIQPGCRPEYLESGLWVGRQGHLGVVEWLGETVAALAVEAAKDEMETGTGGIMDTEKGDKVETALCLVAHPHRQATIVEIGVLVGAPIMEHIDASVETKTG